VTGKPVTDSENAARIAELERRLIDLQARLPAHSIPPSMIVELDDLEEALDRARSQWREEQAKIAREHSGGEP